MYKRYPGSDEVGAARKQSEVTAVAGAALSSRSSSAPSFAPSRDLSPSPSPSPDDGSDELAAESIGRYLSQQRELRGISVDQLAEITRIPKRSIDRLEAGHFDDDVDGFVRGFVRTVANGLGLDPEDTLTRMLAEPRGEVDRARPVSLWAGRSLVVLAAVLLAVLAFGVVRAVWQAGERSDVRAGDEALVWRSDPVRSLAEAHAAGAGANAPTPTPELTAE